MNIPKLIIDGALNPECAWVKEADVVATEMFDELGTAKVENGELYKQMPDDSWEPVTAADVAYVEAFKAYDGNEGGSWGARDVALLGGVLHEKDEQGNWTPRPHQAIRTINVKIEKGVLYELDENDAWVPVPLYKDKPDFKIENGRASRLVNGKWQELSVQQSENIGLVELEHHLQIRITKPLNYRRRFQPPYKHKWLDGTYSLWFDGERHVLRKHGSYAFAKFPRSIAKIRAWFLEERDGELVHRNVRGIVFRHPDGRMAKLVWADLGLTRPES